MDERLSQALKHLATSTDNKSEKAALCGMIRRYIELYGIERYWDGVAGTAHGLADDIKSSAHTNAVNATEEQLRSIELKM